MSLNVSFGFYISWAFSLIWSAQGAQICHSISLFPQHKVCLYLFMQLSVSRPTIHTMDTYRQYWLHIKAAAQARTSWSWALADGFSLAWGFRKLKLPQQSQSWGFQVKPGWNSTRGNDRWQVNVIIRSARWGWGQGKWGWYTILESRTSTFMHHALLSLGLSPSWALARRVSWWSCLFPIWSRCLVIMDSLLLLTYCKVL